MNPCKNCAGTGYILIRTPETEKLETCPECAPRVFQCLKHSIVVQFSARRPEDCPACFLQAEVDRREQELHYWRRQERTRMQRSQDKLQNSTVAAVQHNQACAQCGVSAELHDRIRLGHKFVRTGSPVETGCPLPAPQASV